MINNTIFFLIRERQLAKEKYAQVFCRPEESETNFSWIESGGHCNTILIVKKKYGKQMIAKVTVVKKEFRTLKTQFKSGNTLFA